jgi:hypothetical protein
MRRISSVLFPGLALSLLGSMLFLSGSVPRSLAQDAEKDKARAKEKSPLEGAWQLVSVKDPASGQMRKLPAGIEMTKLVVGGRYVWTVVRNNMVAAGAGGKYTADDESYTESVEFPLAPNQQGMVGKSFKFTWKVEDGKWHHQGTLKAGDAAQEIDEIWERIPSKP